MSLFGKPIFGHNYPHSAANRSPFVTVSRWIQLLTLHGFRANVNSSISKETFLTGSMSIRNKVLFNTAIQFVNRFTISGSAFLVSLIIARYFGSRGYGEYSKATTYLGMFYLVSDFGLNALVLRDMSLHPDREKKILGNLYGLRLVVGIVLTVLAVAVAYLLPYNSLTNEGFTPVSKAAITVLSLLIIYQAFLSTTNVVFQKYLEYAKSTLANVVTSVITVLLVWLLVNFEYSLPIVLSGYVLGAIVGSLVLLVFVKRLFSSFTPLFDLQVYKELFLRSLPLGLTLIFNLVYFRADVFILTLFRTTTEVGIYSLAYKFFEFAITVPTFFVNSVYPILLSRMHKGDEFRKTIIKSSLFLVAISFLVMIVFYFAAPLLRFVREDFIGSIEVLQLLSFSMPIFFISSLFMWIMITYGKNRELLLIYIAGMVINVVLNLYYIPGYGIMAAAWITIISELIVTFMSGYLAVRLLYAERK